MLTAVAPAPTRGRSSAGGRMRAARLHAFGRPPVVETVSRPTPRHAEVLVRVVAAGVCRLDVEIADGLLAWLRLPALLGHEVAGVVEAAGPHARAPLPGTPVLVHGGWGCGECALCEAGEEQLCDARRWCGFGAPGGFAEHLLVPHAHHLIPLHGLDPEAAVPLADAGLTAYRAVRRCLDRLAPGTAAVVIGAGSLGQMAVQILKALTAVHVVSVDLHGRREALARESGADAFVDSVDPAAVRDALEHRPAAAVIDLVGGDSSLALACALVAPQGRVVATGLGGGRPAWSATRLAPEATFTTSRWGSRADLAAVVALAEAGRVFMRTERYPLESVAEAMSAVAQGGVDGRAVLVP